MLHDLTLLSTIKFIFLPKLNFAPSISLGNDVDTPLYYKKKQKRLTTLSRIFGAREASL
jgi:hypothetical protein